MGKQFMTITVNGQLHEVAASPRYSLLDIIRGPLGLKGTKEGCTGGSCGVCTVNNHKGEAILSCLTPALEWDGKEIVTIEGLESEGELMPIQKAFVEYHAVQCGYCTPGVIMSARGVLETFGEPTREEINEGMAGVFCRCTGHIKVREAIEQVKEFEKSPGEPEAKAVEQPAVEMEFLDLGTQVLQRVKEPKVETQTPDAGAGQ